MIYMVPVHVKTKGARYPDWIVRRVEADNPDAAIEVAKEWVKSNVPFVKVLGQGAPVALDS